ncbi:hypothetical protein PM076_08850 [Halorubrum ezzemoulense]|uniref:Uncharacterized protein n=1 Tax=Halorubrum ezzemoulense TaxID=337243 RepID=A0A256KAY9_HALEZ|nr:MULTISPECIES: hypothetical protein [Halorubrum]MDB2243581.1 hypothetical protein [Halorubrum ezzemoulense]MDB2251647.1 hypothetical protein [Halorubrum ezzemoulense]MDB2261889.1 hypothetical protein [Halorubrum ezzemoulense]MDB2268772.1 hypothetical protein [Halorubrum ezzemoulense]MDB2277317.1 hypothetical protein [Halorubrum ezzemoulense]
MPSPREAIREHGWTVEHVPHERIAKYNACYRVELDGELIHPPAADDLGIPRNEVWISEKWSRYDRFILYHELREILYRANGHDKSTAHRLAERDELSLWRDNPRWRVMNAEWDQGRAHLPFPHEGGGLSRRTAAATARSR